MDDSTMIQMNGRHEPSSNGGGETPRPGAGARRIHVMQIIGNAIVGGMETYVLRLVQRLPRDRFRITCLCPNESRFTEDLREAGATVQITPIPIDEPVWRSIQLGCVIARTEAVDVIHAHLANAHLLGGLIGKLVGVPVLTTIHGRDVWIPDLEMHRLVESHVCVVSQAGYYQALGVGVDAGRLHCIPNGVDPGHFEPRPRTGRLQRELGLSPETPLVGFVGRLSPEKGPEVFMRAAIAAASSTRNDDAAPHFVYVGEGPMRAQLEESARAAGLTPRLHFAGLRRNMPDIYPDLDVVVSTSWSEGLPLALMEAMASGRAVVATQVGGVPELIIADTTGKLYMAGHADGIAQGILDFLADPAKRAAVGANARKRIESAFRLSDRIDALGALLTRLAAEKTVRSPSRPAALTPVKTAKPQGDASAARARVPALRNTSP